MEDEQGQPKSFGPVTWLDSGSDVEGVSLSITGADFSDQKQQLTVNWVNRTKELVTFGEPYQLEKQQGDKWVNVQRDEIFFISIGYLLLPEDTRSHTYDLSHTAEALTPGVYRFRTDFFFDKDIPISEDEHKDIWITFWVG